MKHEALEESGVRVDLCAADTQGSIAGMESRSAPSLRQRAIRGSAWMVGGMFVGNSLRLVTNPILAALLMPDLFGLVALSAVIVQGLQMFSDIGIGPSIIQNRRGTDPTFLNTAWTMQFIRGFALWIISCIVTWPMAAFYEDPRLLPLIPVVSLAAVIGGFGSTSLFTQTRELRLARIAVLTLSENVVRALSIIVWAIISPTVWALVGGVLISKLFFAVSSFLFLPGHRPRPAWDRASARELFHFGKWIFVSTVITFFAQRCDILIGGKLLTLDVLGVYSIAMMFAAAPREMIGRLSETVLFPVVAERARVQPERLQTTMLRSRGPLLTAGIGACLALIVVSPWFFGYVYRAEYHDATWMAPLFSVALWFQIMKTTADRTLLAIGHTRTLATSNLVRLLASVTAVLAGYALVGVPGLILGVGVGTAAGYVVVQIALARAHLSVVAQDLRYSAILLIGSGCCVFGRLLSSQLLEGDVRIVVDAVFSFAVLLVLGVWIARRLLFVLKKS